MAEHEEAVRYWLPRTVVTISGSITVKRDDAGRTRSIERISEVSVGTEADPVAFRDLVVERHLRSDDKLELTLADDGRLSGAGQESTGVGAQVLGAGVRIATLVASVAITALPLFLLKAPAPVPLDAAAAERRRLSEQREQLMTLVADLQERALALAADAAAAGGAPDGLAARLETTERALAFARAELGAVDAALAAWRAEHVPDWVTSFTYALGTDALPCRPQAEEEIEVDLASRPDEPSELVGPLADAVRTLHTLPVLIGDEDPTDHSPPDEDHAIVYRLPRCAQLGVYEMLPPDEPRIELGGDSEGGSDGDGDRDVHRFRLRRLTPVLIVDQYSEHRVLPLHSHFFSNHTARFAFGAAGTLTTFSNTDTSTLGTLATAAGAAGSQVVETLEQAGKIAAAIPDPSLAALRDKVMRRELEARLVEANRTIAGESARRA